VPPLFGLFCHRISYGVIHIQSLAGLFPSLRLNSFTRNDGVVCFLKIVLRQPQTQGNSKVKRILSYKFFCACKVFFTLQNCGCQVKTPDRRREIQKRKEF